MRVHTSVPLALALAGALLLTGCGGGAEARKVDPPTVGAGGARNAGAGGTFVKEGVFGGANGMRARVEIMGVERLGAKSVLRYNVTSLESAKKSVTFAIDLLDPVGRLLYRPTGSTSGENFEPGATREMAAEYTAIPQNVAKVTAITPGTAGEFTGIPVTGTADPSAASLARLRGNPIELYDLVEGKIRDVESSPHQVKIRLHADALFTGRSAKLSGRAGALLDETAQEIKTKAMRPLTIVGHTDGRGDDSDNLKLSEERAEAVMKAMKSRLGGDFTYTTSGKGEAEPVAEEGGEDDAKARARNARVEIAYQVKRPADAVPNPPGGPSASTPGGPPATAPGRPSAPAPGVPSAESDDGVSVRPPADPLAKSPSPLTSPPSATPGSPPGGASPNGVPAEFRAEDGEKVASREAGKRRLDVKPFYRDGSYIVAVFDIVGEGPTPATYTHRDYPGGVFTSFSIRVKGSDDVHRAVRIGPVSPGADGSYLDPGRAVPDAGADQPVRGFVYLPAPPGNATTVTFDAGPFGTVEDVPVQ